MRVSVMMMDCRGRCSMSRREEGESGKYREFWSARWCGILSEPPYKNGASTAAARSPTQTHLKPESVDDKDLVI